MDLGVWMFVVVVLVVIGVFTVIDETRSRQYKEKLRIMCEDLGLTPVYTGQNSSK